MSLRHVGSVNGDVVSQRPDVFQLHFIDFEFQRCFLGHDGVVANRLPVQPVSCILLNQLDSAFYYSKNYLHSERLHAGGHFTTDASQTQNGQRFAVQFVAHVLLAVPNAALQGAAGLRNKSSTQRCHILFEIFHKIRFFLVTG